MVGISGGADSVALLHILHQLGYVVTAAHLNHSIRGAEADADEAFVKALCKKLGIKCVAAKTDVPARAKANGISLEMAAREARHEFFRSLTPDSCPLTSVLCPLFSDLCLLTSVLCLAHHADDQLETFFLRAARGSGPSGLGGMRFFQCLENNNKRSCNDFQCLENVDAVSSPRSSCSENAVRTPRLQKKLTLSRPMLGIRRNEIIQWLEKEKIEWREDASNTDETIPRNIVRRQILPILGKLNERAAENILRTMEILRDEEDRPELAARRREIRDWLIEQGVKPNFDSIEKVIEFAAEKNGTKFLDLEGLRITNEYGVLKTVDTVSSPRFSIKIKESVGILRGDWCASISLAKVAGRAVTIRTSQPGDRMEPYGMEGSKKLQDIFTDLKIPKAQREHWQVVECGGEIIWLPGYRIARGWELSTEAEAALHLVYSESGFPLAGPMRSLAEEHSPNP